MASAKLQAVKPIDEQIAWEALLDQFGEDKRAEAEFGPIAARIKKNRDIISARVPEDLPAAEGLSFSGKLYTVNASPRQNEKKPSSMAKLCAFMGPKKFFAVCKIGIGALEEALGKAVAATWLVEDRTGPRSITAVAKARHSEAA